MRRYVHLVTALLVPVLLLVACGATASPNPTTVVSTTTPVKPVASLASKPTVPAATAPSTPSQASTSGIDLTILHTNDVKGYLEPCG